MPECGSCGRNFDTETGLTVHRDTWGCNDEGYKDEDTLRNLYIDERCSTTDIGEIFDVSAPTIHYWLDECGIERRDALEAAAEKNRVDYAKYRMSNKGRMRWHCRVGDSTRACAVHRLLAVAEFGFDEACDMVVHHKNEIPWDNRPKNIELMTLADHTSMHRMVQASDGS